MAKKILKVADKPTLDEVKTLLGKSEEQIEYMHHRVTLDGTGNFQTVLEINGSGILYATACQGQSISNRIVHFRVMIDDTIIFDKGQYVPGTGTAIAKKFGVFSKDFTPNATWYDSMKYIESTMMPGTSSFHSLVLENNYTDGLDISVVGKYTMMARFFKNPIDFYNSLKIEVSSDTHGTTTDVIYSINE